MYTSVAGIEKRILFYLMLKSYKVLRSTQEAAIIRVGRGIISRLALIITLIRQAIHVHLIEFVTGYIYVNIA